MLNRIRRQPAARVRGKLREEEDKARMASRNSEVAQRLQRSAARDKGSPKVGRSDSPKKRHRQDRDNLTCNHCSRLALPRRSSA
jgi:hypothetical protein